MSNYIEYKDTVAFHPGYYIEEIVEESGLTQQEFANRLDTTPKNLSKLINAQQSLSVEMALKLSKMLGTSLEYWLNLQNAYDAVLARMASDKSLDDEIGVLKQLGYRYFIDWFDLPVLPRKLEKQVEQVRRFLGVASLTVLKKPDLSISFRCVTSTMDEKTLVKSNTLVQIATNEAVKIDAPRFDKTRFEAAVDYALTQTTNYDGFYALIKESFLEAGVVLVALPDLKGSKTKGASKRIGSSIMLMVNDRGLSVESFWFTLLHEAGHIINGDLGVSLENEKGNREAFADRFATDALVPPDDYKDFVEQQAFDAASIKNFAARVGRDPGIVLGRLQNDEYIRHVNRDLASLKHKYKVSCGL